MSSDILIALAAYLAGATLVGGIAFALIRRQVALLGELTEVLAEYISTGDVTVSIVRQPDGKHLWELVSQEKETADGN